MNPLLQRFLSKMGETAEVPPSPENWKKFLSWLDEVLHNAEEDRALLERSLALTSKEMQDRWESMHASELLIKAIFNSSVDMIVTIDRDGRMMQANATFEKTFCSPQKGWEGKQFFELVCGAEYGRALEPSLQANGEASQGSLFGRLEVHAIAQDGTVFPLEITITRLDLGTETFFTGTLRDLRSQREAEQLIEIQRTSIVAASKMAALGEMAGGVAHEINTPLAVICLHAEMCAESLKAGSTDPEMLMTSINSISETAQRIGKIVQGLRTFSRDGGGDPLMEVPVRQIVADTQVLCQEKLKFHDVRLEIEDFPDELSVTCRSVEICQVLLNLLNNANDAIESLPGDKWIKIGCKVTEETISLVVTDSGPGIPPELQEKLMRPFFTTKDVGKGTGLGLSISRGIIEAHKGRLFYDSSTPNTRFVIELPRIAIATPASAA
jgi:PAS domain S-box-containing protein